MMQFQLQAACQGLKCFQQGRRSCSVQGLNHTRYYLYVTEGVGLYRFPLKIRVRRGFAVVSIVCLGAARRIR